jgi:hypothetical protein
LSPDYIVLTTAAWRRSVHREISTSVRVTPTVTPTSSMVAGSALAFVTAFEAPSLEDHADTLFQSCSIFDHATPRNCGAAAAGVDLACEHTYSSDLARAIWPKQPKDFAAREN